MEIRRATKLFAASAALALSACGGGGTGTAFRPEPTPLPPPPPPPPPQAEAVTIFTNPTPQDYASVGVWSNIGDLSTPPYDVQLTGITSAESSQPKIRYTADGFYEVQLPGDGFSRLIHDDSIANPTSGNTVFELQSQMNRSFVITGSRNSGYRYSEMAKWARPDLDFAQTVDMGFVAFGTPTPEGGVPVTGAANFQGQILGVTDLPATACDCGFPIAVEGTVALNFNFGAGTLGGSMSMALTSGWGAVPVGDYNFTQTVYSPGGTTYSGRFDTNLSGDNFFLGRFTGPGAEETTGAWAVPFTFGGGTHQAIGAWIAKKGQ